MMQKFKGKKTLGWRAHQAAVRTVPMIGDPEAYRRAMDYFRLGYARGFATAQRLAKQSSSNEHTQEKP